VGVDVSPVEETTAREPLDLAEPVHRVALPEEDECLRPGREREPIHLVLGDDHLLYPELEPGEIVDGHGEIGEPLDAQALVENPEADEERLLPQAEAPVERRPPPGRDRIRRERSLQHFSKQDPVPLDELRVHPLDLELPAVEARARVVTEPRQDC